MTAADRLSETETRFSPDFRSQRAGTPLAKAATSANLAAWEATPNLRFAGREAGGGITVTDTSPFMGRLPIPAGSQIITAEIHARITPTTGWMALGIGAPQLGSPTWGKGVYVMLNPDGTCALAGNDDPSDWASRKTKTLKRGRIPDFDITRPVTLKIEYNRAANTTGVWLNEAKFADDLSLAGKGFTVDPAFAGFSGFRQATGHTIVEKFSLKLSSTRTALPSVIDQPIQPALTPAWWNADTPAHFQVPGGKLPPGTVLLKAVVTDVSGQEIHQDKIPRAEAETAGWRWSAPAPGFYEVAFFQVDASGRETAFARSFDLRAPNGATRTFRHTRQGFAVLPPLQPVNETVGQFGFTYTLNPRNIPLARLIGFDLANIHPIPWGANFTNLNMAIEPKRGEYHWEILDPHVNALAEAGIRIAGQFCYTPLWASPYPEKTNINICVVEGTAYAPRDINDYSRFVEATVTRYKDRIRTWELWNEPAVPGGSVFWSDTPENFVRLIEAGYRTIKRVQPESEVWLGGLGGRAAYYSFYNRLLSLGATPSFDMLSLHGKGSGGSDEFRRINETHQSQPKPIVMSEWHAILQGNSQSSPPLPEDALSLSMMQSLLLQLKEGISRTILFEMTNLVEKEALLFAGDNKWFVHSSGLFRRLPRPEPRQAAVVMANFLDASGRKAVFVKELEPAKDVFAIQLSTNRGPLLVLWNENGAIPASVPDTFATPQSRLIDWEGKPVPLTKTAALTSKRLYYLSAPDTTRLAAATPANRLVPAGSKTPTTHKTVEGIYHNGPLFESVKNPPTVPPSAWITQGWTTTTTAAAASKNLNARAAVGAHENGLDLVIEVTDTTHHTGTEPPATAWNGDSVQIGIDCETTGQAGGHTELIAALLTGQGPVLWKLAAADTRGDIPARWSPAKGPVRHATTHITRGNGQTRYHIRLDWTELYPLVHDTMMSKPLRIALVVNDNNGTGRTTFLEWGQGIARDKNPALYGKLHPGSVPSKNNNH
ncbi:MAG: hypothetical protein LBK99_13335 [Opitutaceae bacterium]|nr:hypothetical protein [Opitutaceae bacterium]